MGSSEPAFTSVASETKPKNDANTAHAVFGNDASKVRSEWAAKIASLNNRSRLLIHSKDIRDSATWHYPFDSDALKQVWRSRGNGGVDPLDFYFWKGTDPIMSTSFVDDSLASEGMY